VVKAGEEFIQALTAAVQRGDSAEELWNGQSVMRDPAARSVQMRFIDWARQPDSLRSVLRNSSDASHRALAAHILGHAADPQAVIPYLVDAIADSSDEVRNNAMRALAVIARAQSDSPRPVRVPPEPFVAMLDSPVWSDRNKAALALMELTTSRDRVLLGYLRREALVPLTEMARWKSQGHAMPAFMILGRIAGRSEDEIQAAWSQGKREELIDRAIQPH
jgi:HEAT repeat protein